MDENAFVQIAVASITSGSAALLVRGAYARYRSWRGGLEKRKRSEIDSLSVELTSAEQERDVAIADRDRAVLARDAEASQRRRYAEHASDLRRMLMESCGIAAADLPDWPQ